MKAAILTAILALPLAGTAQTAPQTRRLTAQAYYLNSLAGFQLEDSARYAYGSPTRGSRFDHEYLRYTDLQNLGTSPDADFTSQRIPVHNIDSAGLPHADYDSAWFRLGITQTPPNTIHSFETHRYTAGGAIAEVMQQVTDPVTGVQLYGHRSIEVYTGGRLDRSYVFSFNGLSYDTSFIRYYVYNGGGQLLLDSLSLRLTAGNYTPYRKISFAYGAAPRYVASTVYSFRPSPSRLVPDLLDSLSYYPDGRLQRRKSFFMGASGNFLPEALDSFAYTAGVKGFTWLREDLLDTLGAAEYTFFTTADRVNARGQKDSMTVTGFRGAASLGNNRIAVAYDTAGYPLTRTEYFSSNGAAPYSVEVYYYEDVPRLSVAATAADARLSMFPNPCRDRLSYRLDGLPAGTAITLEILNHAGQLAYREQTRWTGSPQPLVLPEMPAGTYMLQVVPAGTQPRSSLQFTRL